MMKNDKNDLCDSVHQAKEKLPKAYSHMCTKGIGFFPSRP